MLHGLQGRIGLDAPCLAGGIHLLDQGLLGVILLLITGFWQFILVLGVAGPLIALWYASAYLQKAKRGRPDGYYTQAIHLWLAKRAGAFDAL